jgi:hypothetical protein
MMAGALAQVRRLQGACEVPGGRGGWHGFWSGLAWAGCRAWGSMAFFLSVGSQAPCLGMRFGAVVLPMARAGLIAVSMSPPRPGCSFERVLSMVPLSRLPHSIYALAFASPASISVSRAYLHNHSLGIACVSIMQGTTMASWQDLLKYVMRGRDPTTAAVLAEDLGAVAGLGIACECIGWVAEPLWAL